MNNNKASVLIFLKVIIQIAVDLLKIPTYKQGIQHYKISKFVCLSVLILQKYMLNANIFT